MNAVAPRRRQSVPAEIVSHLLNYIRSHFMAGLDDKQWHQQKHFLIRQVITWPAQWLDERGVTLPPERYQQILMDVFKTIEQKREQAVVNYWPGYLMKCLQDHFKFHGEEYYEEGKSVRYIAALNLDHIKSLTQKNHDEAVRRLAEVHQVLVKHHKSKHGPAQVKQLDLFK